MVCLHHQNPSIVVIASSCSSSSKARFGDNCRCAGAANRTIIFARSVADGWKANVVGDAQEEGVAFRQSAARRRSRTEKRHWEADRRRNESTIMRRRLHDDGLSRKPGFSDGQTVKRNSAVRCAIRVAFRETGAERISQPRAGRKRRSSVGVSRRL